VTLNQVRSAPSYICCSAFFLTAFFHAVPVLAAKVLTQPPTLLTAVVLPQGRYSEVAVREMGREAANILKHSGVSLHLHLGTPAQAISGRLVVVKLQGICDMDGPPAYLVPGPLGWSHEVDGTVLPFSDLACDNIRGAVHAVMPDENQIRGNVLLGRAMGRVLAHELYHVVADTSEHGRDGVAQEALSPLELTSGRLELQPSEVAAVQSGINRTR
jgi:hypothetical protein